MGAALFTDGARRNFSVITFGIAQIAMDIEPADVTGADVLHGPAHTILGALIIAYLVMLISPRVCSYLLTKWNKEVIHYKGPRLVQPEAVPKTSVVIGAFFRDIESCRPRQSDSPRYSTLASIFTDESADGLGFLTTASTNFVQ